MQVFIERMRRIAHRGGYIQLILCGGSVFSIRIYGWVDGFLASRRRGVARSRERSRGLCFGAASNYGGSFRVRQSFEKGFAMKELAPGFYA